MLARPNSIQAQFGFPTKLGEYLMTAKPVVVTSTGEIPCYLQDNEHAYIALPDDDISLSEKLREALRFPDKSLTIGRNGKKQALKYFNNKHETKKILDFIDRLF